MPPPRTVGTGRSLMTPASIKYSLRAEFPTPQAAPMPTSYSEGIGRLNFSQNDGQLSISGHKLVLPGQTTPSTGDQGFYGEATGGGAFARLIGRTLLTQVNLSNASSAIYSGPGWARSPSASSNSYDAMYYITSGAINVGVSNTASPGYVGAVANSIDYQLAISLRSVGAYYFIKGGAFTDWTLLWVSTTQNTANLYPSYDNYNGIGTIEYFRVRDLLLPFDTDLGFVTLSQPSPVSGTTYVADADGIYHLTITAPGTLANTTELRYRVQDANNYWTAFLNSAGDLKVDSVTGGISTNRLSVAGVIGAGATVTLCVITSGSKHNVYTLSAGTWTKRGSEINISYLDTLTAIRPQVGSGWSVSNLRAWPRVAAAYSKLSKV